MSWFGLWSEGFLLGLALSPSCLAFCLPLLIPFFAAEARTVRANLSAFLIFLVSRLAGYVAIGALAGWLGQALTLPPVAGRRLTALTLAALGLLLLVYGFVRNFPHWSWCRSLGRITGPKRTAAALGLLTGVNICPPFLAALAAAVQAGGWLRGAWVFTAFFFGTSLILLPLPWFGRLGESPAWRAAGRVAAALVGAWLLLQAWAGLRG